MRKQLIIIVALCLPLASLADSVVKLDSLTERLSVVSGKEKIKTFIYLSNANRNISFTDCINYGLRAAKLAEKEKDYTLAGLAYKSLGVSCYFSGDLKRALDYFNKGLLFYSKNENKRGMSNCLNNIGLLYDAWSRFDSAYYYYNKSYIIEKKLDDKAGMAISLINMGNINYYRKNMKHALDNYYQAMLLFQETQDKNGLAKAYNSLGIIYWEWDNYNEALGYFNKARDIYKASGNDRGLARTYTNLAEIYNNVDKKYKVALDFYKKSLQIKEKLDDRMGMALLYNDIGTLYGNIEDFSKAKKYFLKSFDLYTQLKSKKGKTMSLYNVGKLYQQKKEDHKAIKFFNKSLKFAKNIGFTEYVNSNYEGLFKCYASLCNYPFFEKYYNLFSSMQDSLLEKLRQAQMLEIEAKYKAEELQSKSFNIQRENAEKGKMLFKYRLILTAVIGIIILLLLTYLLFFRIKKNHQE